MLKLNFHAVPHNVECRIPTPSIQVYDCNINPMFNILLNICFNVIFTWCGEKWCLNDSNFEMLRLEKKFASFLDSFCEDNLHWLNIITTELGKIRVTLKTMNNRPKFDKFIVLGLPFIKLQTIHKRWPIR